MQVADLSCQLEAARNAIVHLHTRLTTATKDQQAVASRQNQRLQQLEVQQADVHGRLNSITTTIANFQDRNNGAISDLRSRTNTFLTELISVVGQQFGKLQADLKQSQADHIKAEVQTALNEAFSPEAGNTLLQQWVHGAVIDLVKEHKGHQIGDVEDKELFTGHDGVPCSPHRNKENGLNTLKNNSKSEEVCLPAVRGQAVYPAQNQASVVRPYKPGVTQVALVAKETLEAATLSVAAKRPVTRSQDSLSLMHHASAAGSRTPTPAKSDFARLSQMAGLPGSARWPKTQSPTDGRQALAEISLNQRSVGQQTGPQSISSSWQERQYVEHKEQQAPALTEHSLHQSHAGMQAALKSTNMAWQPHQSVLQYGSDMPADIASRDPSPMAIRSAEKHEMQQTERQHEQLQTVPVQQQSLPRRIGQRQEESSRQNKQLRWAGTARQLQQGSEQPAKVIGSSDWAVPSNQDANCGQQCSIQYDRVRACDSVTLHQDKSMHAEELQVLAQMLEPTGSTLSRGLQSLAYSATMQGVMPGSWWEVPHTHDPHHDAAIAGSSLSDSGIDRVPEDRQYATEVPRHMQSPHTSSSVQRALTNHHAMQQLSAAPHDGSVGKIGSMHCRAGLAGGEMHDLPAGIPLTPVPDQEPHPRDSLEASIWKLSGNGRRRTAGLREASAAWTSRGRSPRRYRAVHEQKQPSGAQGLSQPVVQDRLEASLRLLAARQERTGCAEST